MNVSTSLPIRVANALVVTGTKPLRGSVMKFARPAVTAAALVVATAGMTLSLGTAVAVAAPANDDRNSPQVIGNPPSPVSGDTSQATADPSDPTPQCSGSPLAGTLWYSWTPAASGDVRVDLQAGSGTVPIAAFYTADGSGNLTRHACTTGGQATFQFTGGQTYLLMVGQYTGCCSPGPFTLTLTPSGAVAAPANDVRSSPQVIGNPPSPVSGDTSQATADPSDPTPQCSGSPLAGTLWYSWTPAASGDVRVDLQAGSGTVPIAAFYTADGSGNLTRHACTTGGQATFQFTGGQTYLLMVGQYTGCCSPGPFTLTLTPSAPPPGGELTLTGFFAPIDMGGILNTVKAGATVPLKFRVFDAGVEQTDVAIVAGFTTKSVDCTSGTGADPVEELSTTGGTTLHYDPTEQQFLQNWKSPKKPGCYAVTVTAVDGSSITALFKLN
jgi:hypothetical protein